MIHLRMFLLVTRLSLVRALRMPLTLVPLAGSLVTLFVAILLERRTGTHLRADALTRTPYLFLFPFVPMAAAQLFIGGKLPGPLSGLLLKTGARRVDVLLPILGLGAISACVLAFVATLVAAAISGDVPLGQEFVSARVFALAAFAYSPFFAFGTAFGPRGSAVGIFFLLDYVLGTTSGTFALLTPRGHLRNLLGIDAPHGWSQPQSSIALVILALTYSLLALRRARS